MNEAPPSESAIEPVVHLDGARFAYHRGVDVVRGVSASLHPNTVHFLLGPNGVGKSTLVRLMLGQLKPSAGCVVLGGQAAHRMSARRLAGRVSYVPQRSNAAFAFTVGEVIAMGRYAGPRDASAVRRAMEACDLVEFGGRPFIELSVGQQQRAMVARAIAQSDASGSAGSPPRTILLDEPTSAMDLAHVHRTMRTLCGLAHDGGAAVLIVAQDINLAARYADRVWLMKDGTLAADDTWGRVLTPDLLGGAYGVTIRSVRHEDADSRPIFEVTDVPVGVDL